MGINFNTDGLQKGLNEYRKRVDKKLTEYFETQALEFQKEMIQGVGVPAIYRKGKDPKTGKMVTLKGTPWIDRTNAAKKNLKAVFSKKGNNYIITLVHGVKYGIWLEFAHEKRYAIIVPTLKRIEPIVVDDVNGMIRAG